MLIQPYDPQWSLEFEKIKVMLNTILDGIVTEIEHVGSTAIAGVCAKPILDIDIVIEHKLLLGEIQSKLEQAGYHARGEQGIPGRFAFGPDTGAPLFSDCKNNYPSHHLYVCYSDSLALKNHLLFRDTLRANKDLAGQYADLKRTLTENTSLTRSGYARQKTEFILSVLTVAGLTTAELEEIRVANL